MQKPCLLVINDFGTSGGGAEVLVRTLLPELVRSRKFSKIFLLEHESSNSSFPGVQTIHTSGGLSGYSAVKKLLSQHDFAAIHVHNTAKLGLGVLQAVSSSSAKKIWFAWDYWAICPRRNLVNPKASAPCSSASFSKCISCSGTKNQAYLSLVRCALNRFDAAIAPSNFVKNLFEEHGVLKGKWRIVPAWIDLAPFKSVRRSSKPSQDVYFTGPLAPFKGSKVAVRAFAIVAKRFPKSRLFFAGSQQEKTSPYRIAIEKIAAEAGVLGRVRFLGFLSHQQLAKRYSSAGVYVAPTLWPEQFGLNWAEAMAAGVPVVASKIGSIPEFVKAGRGLVVPPGDEKGLAGAISSVFSNRVLSSTISKKGRRYSLMHFDSAKSAEKILIFSSA